MMDVDTKGGVQRRLKRISGQVAGIERMVDDDRYCVDVLHQISAVRAALAKVGSALLESHMRTCVTTAFASGDDAERKAKLDEVIALFDKHCGC